MSKKISLLDKIELWLDMDKTTIQIALSLVIIGICSLVFSRYEKIQNKQQPDISIYTESTRVTSINYEKIFGYAPMDSAVPPVTGIKVKYTYQVNNQLLTGKQTFYKKGFKEIMNGINKTPEILEIRYNLNQPEESIVAIREIR